MKEPRAGSWECPVCLDGVEHWDLEKYGITECHKGHVIKLLYAENGRMSVASDEPAKLCRQCGGKGKVWNYYAQDIATLEPCSACRPAPPAQGKP